MEEQEVPHTYQRGFNDGYQLAKHEPELLARLLKTNGQQDYLRALEAGQRQYQKEALMEQMKQEELRRKEKYKDQGRGR